MLNIKKLGKKVSISNANDLENFSAQIVSVFTDVAEQLSSLDDAGEEMKKHNQEIIDDLTVENDNIEKMLTRNDKIVKKIQNLLED